MIVERSGYELLAALPIFTGGVCIAVFMRMLARLDEQHERLSEEAAGCTDASSM